jgi:peptide-methionine (R)-S-oxide reductase
MVERRSFLKLLGLSAFAATLGNALHAGKVFAAEVIAKIERITMTDEEWKKKLSPQQYDVLREEGTERAFSSPLNEEQRDGMFVCAGCDLPLFPSKFKYRSGTGWPSFYDVLPGHVETKTDYKIGLPRTEYHCAKCGGHQGHVFEDGPKPTGLRYCNNGVALKFVPDKSDV